MKKLKLFNCENCSGLRLTQQGCSNLYYVANKEASVHQNLTLAAHSFCFGCPIGAENYKKHGSRSIKQVKSKKKQCLLFQIAPTKCKNSNIDGYFSRKRRQVNHLWDKQKFCCPQCGVVYNQLKSKGLIK